VQSRIVLLRAAALGVAVVQLVLAAGSGAEEFWLIALLAWGGAVFVARADEEGTPPLAAGIAGALLVACSILELATAPGYRAAHRLAPLAGGLGLLLFAGGHRWIRANGRALLLLSLPVLYPPPIAVREFLDTSPATAFLGAWLLRLWGIGVERKGTLLLLKGSSLTVAGACSGINQICELLALAILATVVLEAGRRRAAWLAASAVAVGLLVNAVRIALLAVLAEQGKMGLFDLWHTGAPSLLVSGIATLLWGGLAFLVLRRIKVADPPRDLHALPACPGVQH
jgi:cyanoexosortase A